MWLIIRGNILDGFEYIGPFLEAEEAEQWAIDNDNLYDWVVTTLEDPGILADESDDDEEEEEVLAAVPVIEVA